MAKRATTDHGEIIHFAGRHHLFPVARRDDPAAIRLASRDDLTGQEVRIGWPAFYRPFIDRKLVFVSDETGGQVMTRAEADELGAAPPSGPAGEASASAASPGGSSPLR
jgi:hypothetical protein